MGIDFFFFYLLTTPVAICLRHPLNKEDTFTKLAAAGSHTSSTVSFGKKYKRLGQHNCPLLKAIRKELLKV